MKRLLLVGNPNVGKSVIFSRLTGARVIASNYPGTTVEFTKGKAELGHEPAEVIDVPGTYTLTPTSKAEQVATEMLDQGDVILNVVDATNLERNLNLTLELLSTGKPVIVALNLWDEAAHRGVEIDVEKLEALLGVPVVPTCALSGEGIKTVVSRLDEARPGALPHEPGTRWARVGHIVEQVQHVVHRHHTFLDNLADLSLRPWTGIPLALVMATICFTFIRLIGEGLIGYILDPLFNTYWLPLMQHLSAALGPGTLLHELLIGHLTPAGQISLKESMGLLTTALYIPLAQVYPYVFAFYIVLSVVEDFGYLPRLGVLVDTIMHRLGLHGLTIIPTLLGLGCGVPGALATRILESRRQRFISAVLIAICVPCMAQTAMVVALLGQYGAAGLGLVFGTLALLWLVLALAFKRFLPGEAPEIFTEIPPYRLPYPKAVAQKVWLRGKQFLLDAVPFVILGVLAVDVLNILHVIDALKLVLAPVLTRVLGLPPEAVTALLIGFLRKDVAVGMLAPLGLNFKQLVVACVVLTTFFPCAASFVVLLKEFGVKDMLKASALMVVVSMGVGALLNAVL
jgi:ferrous iron transport protein B